MGPCGRSSPLDLGGTCFSVTDPDRGSHPDGQTHRNPDGVTYSDHQAYGNPHCYSDPND